MKKFTHSEFDHNAGDFRKDPSAVYKLLHAAGVGQSEHYGGFWVVPTYETVQSVAHDTDTVSNTHLTLPPSDLV